MTRHALDCGLCCGLEKCDCGADEPPPEPEEDEQDQLAADSHPAD